MKKINFINKRVVWFIVMLLLPISQMWAYTLTFATGSNSSTKADNKTTCASLLSAGTDYVTGNCGSPSNVYASTASNLRLGNSSASGSLTIGLSASGQVSATTIVVNAKQYSSGKTKTLSVNGKSAQTPGDDWGDLEFTINASITSISLSASGYLYIKSITVNSGTCSADVSIGTASLNGSFNLTT